MPTPYLVPKVSNEAELFIKKSRFIGYLSRVTDRNEADDKIQKIRQNHPKANHHCYGFVAGPPDSPQAYGFSDDGEPSGTAGKPILNVLQHSNIGEILIVVVRYFGGVKLGTGGLVSAYSDCANKALNEIETEWIEERLPYYLEFSYATEPMIRNLLEKLSIVPEVDYNEKVLFKMDLTSVELTQIDTVILPLNIQCKTNRIP